MKKRIEAEKLGAIIRIGRNIKKLTQLDVSRKTGINQGTLCSYERGDTVPDAITYRKLEKLLGLDAIERELFAPAESTP